MPTYEYECTKCGHRFEYFQGIKEEPLKECPRCSSPVKRLISSGAGIIFRGSGFYETDYKKKRKEPEAPKCPNAAGDNPACASCDAKGGNKQK
jgi:putative FmdB family regulatory protein